MFDQQAYPAGYHFLNTELPTMYSASVKCGSTTGEELTTGYTLPKDSKVGYFAGHKGPVYSTGFAAVGIYANTSGILLAPAVEKTLKSRPMGTVVTGDGDGYPFSLTRLSDYVRQDLYQGDSEGSSPSNVANAISYIHGNYDITGSEKTVMDGYFGVGNNTNSVLDHSYYYLEALQGVDAQPISVHKIYAARILAQKPRGYKYGLIASTPKKLSSVFRNDVYGQYRDMLEQRHYTSLFINDPVDVANSRTEKGLVRRQNQTFIAAVTCTFRSPVFENPTASSNVTKVSPAETNCSNLSNQMTSSVPYFDGVLKNRDGPPTTDTDVVIT
jgi:hypothetical protein